MHLELTKEQWKETFKAARAKTGLSQAGLAMELEMSKRNIADWELGRSMPPHWAQILLLEKMETIGK